MRIVRTVAELRAALRDAGRVGFVPTMGALHDGHLSLIRAARAAVDTVVTSVFVNPMQFNDARDLEAYPRDEARDADLAASAGTDVLFVPSPAEMYPDGYATTVSVRGVSEPLEGAHRGAIHFDGVATVVAKLLIAVAPDVAYFGQKDAQQVAVVRRLVADLGLPVEIAVVPIVREPDGLAMSSRNVRLSAADRPRALALKAGLDAVAAALSGGAAARDAERRGADVMRQQGVDPEYLALVDPATFAPADDLTRPTLAVVAAHVGDVRLIDNLTIPAREEA
ncbi:pantoate--beta-alanine ligase [Tessaracoccus lapidicaptus]|uniref:Pantothenate synthetase n=1 Tax=Tessaracoccus lapidicaptus TaxID=1427523 RepID=A0A1C0AIV1_9ACTN|nr:MULTISPECIES: pantoate--beta-alanine ligase [Tessaracoccus]AQX15772.1 pantoate--beta-alanine ligase [Tessaracoccus sp. T2.5-30]OCL32050.1 pantoate--beta-alanine ligase [Tessaracoccus lapidicaptus]VEP40183.1 Pantothenate synthetase [Tessaracoccus lapidicaptus]